MKRCPKCFGSIRRMGHIEKPFYCPECKEWFSNEEVTPKPTNADRIRAMTDEELAELLRDTQCNTCAWQGNDCDYADECKAEKLEMLKQECDDNGT